MADAYPDAELWELLREQVAPDRVPDHVHAAALASLSWRDPDSALAALVADSEDHDGAAGLLEHVRGGSQPRLLTFTADEVTIDVEAHWHGRSVTLIGQLVPAGRADVSADHPGGVAAAVADELGRFQIGGLAPGPVRLRCAAAAGGAPVHTDWVLL